MSLVLPAELRRRIEGEAMAAYPHEGCGFLLGALAGSDAPSPSDGTGGDLLVSRVRPAANARTDSPGNRYLIEPEEFLRALREAERDGLDVVGFYHSHPDAPARPSQFDRDHAWPWYAYLIVSVRDRAVGECRAWVLRRERGEFEERDIREGA